MTYGQLLRKLARLSEVQLSRDVTITNSSMTVFDIDRIVVWSDDINEEDLADVEMQISVRE